MDGGGSEGVAEKPSRDSPGFGWNVTLAFPAPDGDAIPISGASRASFVTVSLGGCGTGAGAWSVVRNGSPALADIHHRPSSGQGSRAAAGRRATVPVVRRFGATKGIIRGGPQMPPHAPKNPAAAPGSAPAGGRV